MRQQKKSRWRGASIPLGAWAWDPPKAAPHVIALRPFLRFWRRQRLHVGSAMCWIASGSSPLIGGLVGCPASAARCTAKEGDFADE
jgi:hypothetical protein